MENIGWKDLLYILGLQNQGIIILWLSRVGNGLSLMIVGLISGFGIITPGKNRVLIFLSMRKLKTNLNQNNKYYLSNNPHK